MIINGENRALFPAHWNFGNFILHRFKQANPLDVCLENYNTGETLTYKDFTDYAVSLSVALSKLGVTRGDIVAVGSEKRIMFLPTTLAVVLTGASYTPYDLRSGTAVLQYKLNLAKPNYFICSNSFWKTYSDVLKSCDFIKTFICFEEIDDIELSIKKLILKHREESFEPAVVHGQTDVALILYSSGTTSSMPKGVLITHYNCVLGCLPEKFPDESLKTAVLFGEWYHRYETFSTYKFLWASIGRKVVFANNLTNQDTILKVIQHCKVNVAIVVPSVVSYLATAKEIDTYNTSTLRLIFSCGCTLHPSLPGTVKRRIPTVKNVLQIYGMTEVGDVTSEDWGTKGPKTGSIGMACPNVSIKIVDPKTREILGPNQRGEICIRGPTLMKGYIGMDSSTYLDQDGFFLSGDLGYYDEDTYFYFVDRLKDVISFDGYQVDPTELEFIILSNPEVREAAVVGKPAGAYGEQPAAIVVLQPERHRRVIIVRSNESLCSHSSTQCRDL
ncbi:hypothetical protein MSG28_008004 [Choristoneura fumiferana]|uniref:Uncharacterized protein n=1 Tax=Choristoneura fumiferana TaxID=7141 RepID=A0ACC0J9Q4_CHOFU|nr:hypothetical protein MSG28_008004 [Choristoneura fumiferana]